MLLEEAESGALLGAVPLYVKSHSYGEYVFDWGWADAYERAGGRYYPKARPVSLHPGTGLRLLLGDTADADTQRILGEAIVSAAGQLGLSGLHLTFPEKAEFDALGELDAFEQRLGLQYHWHNANYASLDDFLGAPNSRKRRRSARSAAKSPRSISTSAPQRVR